MNLRSLRTIYRATLLLALAGSTWSMAVADPAPATAAVPDGKLVSSYSDFAGSPENSSSLVYGLRTGAPITLTDSTYVGGPPPNSTTFTSPTKPMGYGNVRIALSLAQAKLASEGISQPTATELQWALMGGTRYGPDGTATTTEGVLQMRASGMGWGNIANSMGYKLGPVVSGHQTLVPKTTNSSTVTTANGTYGKGVAATKGNAAVTGAGNVTHGKSTNVTTGLGHASSNAGGVVTAAGGSAGSNSGGNVTHGKSTNVTTGLGHASSNASGVVTAAGGSAGSNSGGNAKGGGKP